MATTVSTLTQEPSGLNLAWRTGDAVNMRFVIRNADWTGTYLAEVRASATSATVLATLTVTATLCGLDTEFILTLSEANSLLVPAGKYVWDLQDTVINLTRLTGTVTVSQDVSRP